MDFDLQEVLRRLLRYLFAGLAISISSVYLIKGGNVQQTIMLGVLVAAVYAILDLLLPTAGASARIGSGLMLGAKLAGM